MESDIPFPLLSGQYIKYNGKYYKVTKQPKMFDFPFPYELPPSGKLNDNSIQLNSTSKVSAFSTSENQMKEWVTWIDNDYLGIVWNIASIKINSINGISEPETKYTSPFGSVNFPKFIFNNATGSVSFNLINTNPVKFIAGTIHIIMYDYKVALVDGTPDYYTDISYGD